MKINKCPKCGKILKKGVSFCTECGAAAEAVEAAENTEPRKQNNCRQVLHKNRKRIFCVLVAAVFLCAVGLGIYGGTKYQEKRKQQRIDEILASLEEDYQTMNFPVIFQHYDELDKLGYDTSAKQKIALYDQKNYAAAVAVYDNIQSINTKIHTGDYQSLSSLMELFDDTLDAAEQIEINEESQIGMYLNDLTSDFWYAKYKSTYYHTTIDLDYGLTSDGHAFVITVYTEPLAKIAFPYDEQKVNFQRYTAEEGNSKTELDESSGEESASTDAAQTDEAQDSETGTENTDSVSEDDAKEDPNKTEEMTADEKSTEEQSSSISDDEDNTIAEADTTEDSTSSEGTSDDFYPITEYNKQPDYSKIYAGNLKVDYSNLPENLDIHLFPTEHGEICGFITNTSNEVIHDVNIQLNYKDANGQTIKTDKDGHDALLPGYTVVSRFDCPKEFSCVSFEFDFSSNHYENHSPYVNINSNIGENNIILEITNNWDKKISEIEYDVILYKKNRIVEIKYPEDVNGLEAGKTITKEVNTSGQEFDRYEIYLNQAHTFR